MSVSCSSVCTLVHQALHADGHRGVCSGQHVFDGRLFRPASPYRGRLLSTMCLCLRTCTLTLHVSVSCHLVPAVHPNLPLHVIFLLVYMHSGVPPCCGCSFVCLSAFCPVSQCNFSCNCTTDHILLSICIQPPLSKPNGSCAADPCASAESSVCLQAFFGFFSKLNSYWVAPMVNLVFIVSAILTQLCLATPWGKAVLAWLTPKHAFMKVALNPQPDKGRNILHRSNSLEADTEQQRLLASAHWNSMQSTGASEGHNATQLEMLYEGPAGLCVEMAHLDGQ